MLTVVAVAFAAQSPQIGVAEFAPAARETDLQAPPTSNRSDGATGRNGRRPTTTAGGLASATTTPTGESGASAPTTKVPRTRTCVGVPPRQTEDPMSPSCVATIFEGDNGGATSVGVTGTEIRVAVPWHGTPNDTRLAAIRTLFDHVNQRFELYGRRLQPLVVPGSAYSAPEARAKAADIASQQPFAAVTGLSEFAMHAAMPQELGRQGVVTMTQGATTWWTDHTFYDANHPYLWSVYPSSEDLQTNIAAFACSSLAGRQATHAGDPALRSKPRRFGIVSFGSHKAPDVPVLARALTECTGQAPLQTTWSYYPASTLTPLRTGIEKMRNDGATTLICACQGDWAYNAVGEAGSGAKFFPEWVMTPSDWGTGNDEEFFQLLVGDFKAMAPPVRISPGPRMLPIQARPWYGLLQEMLNLPGAAVADLMTIGEMLYPGLLALASGIQAAGPMLTPGTFATGLMAAQFPNPGAGQAPYYQPSAGFGPGDHSFYDDYHVAWWSDSAEALDTPSSPRAKGSWCYLQQAARFAPGTYPVDADAALFNPDVACR